MKLERNALKALIKESLQDIVREQDAPADPGAQTAQPPGGDYEASGSGASVVNTMMKRLKAQKPIMDMLLPMAGKQEALVAVAVIAKTLGVEISDHAPRLKTLQNSVKDVSK